MKVYRFVLGLLTLWRITHLLQAEDGPWDIVVRLRRVAGNGFWGKLPDCFYCLSLWVATPLAFSLGENSWERAFLWPSLSAVASSLEQATNPALNVAPVHFAENQAQRITMACCGQRRQQTSRVMPTQRANNPAFSTNLNRLGAQPRTAYFQYVGKTALTAIGPISGRHYRFNRPGAIVGSILEIEHP